MEHQADVNQLSHSVEDEVAIRDAVTAISGALEGPTEIPHQAIAAFEDERRLTLAQRLCCGATRPLTPTAWKWPSLSSTRARNALLAREKDGTLRCLMFLFGPHLISEALVDQQDEKLWDALLHVAQNLKQLLENAGESSASSLPEIWSAFERELPHLATALKTQANVRVEKEADGLSLVGIQEQAQKHVARASFLMWAHWAADWESRKNQLSANFGLIAQLVELLPATETVEHLFPELTKASLSIRTFKEVLQQAPSTYGGVKRLFDATRTDLAMLDGSSHVDKLKSARGVLKYLAAGSNLHEKLVRAMAQHYFRIKHPRLKSGWTLINYALLEVHEAFSFDKGIRFGAFEVMAPYLALSNASEVIDSIRTTMCGSARIEPNLLQAVLREATMYSHCPAISQAVRGWNGADGKLELDALSTLATEVTPLKSTSDFKLQSLQLKSDGTQVIRLCTHYELMLALANCRRFRQLLHPLHSSPTEGASHAAAFERALDRCEVIGDEATAVVIAHARRAHGIVRRSAHTAHNFDAYCTELLGKDLATEEEENKLIDALRAVEASFDVLAGALDPADLEQQAMNAIAEGRCSIRLEMNETQQLERQLFKSGEKDLRLSQKLPDIFMRLNTNGDSEEKNTSWRSVFLKAWTASQAVLDALQRLEDVRYPVQVWNWMERIAKLEWVLGKEAEAQTVGGTELVNDCEAEVTWWLEALKRVDFAGLKRNLTPHQIKRCVEEICTGTLTDTPHILGALSRSGPVTWDVAIESRPSLPSSELHEKLMGALQALLKKLPTLSPPKTGRPLATHFSNSDNGVASLLKVALQWHGGFVDAAPLEMVALTECTTSIDVDFLVAQTACRPVCIIVTEGAVINAPAIVNQAIQRCSEVDVLFAFDETNSASHVAKWKRTLPALRQETQQDLTFPCQPNQAPCVFSGPAGVGKTTRIREWAKNKQVEMVSLFLTEEVYDYAQRVPLDLEGSLLGIHLTAGALEQPSTNQPTSHRVDVITGPLRVGLLLYDVCVHRRLRPSHPAQFVRCLSSTTLIAVEEPERKVGESQIVQLVNKERQRVALERNDVLSHLSCLTEAAQRVADAYVAVTSQGTMDAKRRALADCIGAFGAHFTNWHHVNGFISVLATLLQSLPEGVTRDDFNKCAKQAALIASPPQHEGLSLHVLKETPFLIGRVSDHRVLYWEPSLSLKDHLNGPANEAKLKNGASWASHDTRRFAVLLAGALGRRDVAARLTVLRIAKELRFWLSADVVFRAIVVGLRCLAGLPTIISGSPGVGKSCVATFVARVITEFHHNKCVRYHNAHYLSMFDNVKDPPTLQNQIRANAATNDPEAFLRQIAEVESVNFRKALRTAFEKSQHNLGFLRFDDPQVVEPLKKHFEGNAASKGFVVEGFKLFVEMQKHLVMRPGFAQVVAHPSLTGRQLYAELTKVGTPNIFDIADELDKLENYVVGIGPWAFVDECNTMPLGVIQTFVNDRWLDGRNTVSSRVGTLFSVNPYKYSSSNDSGSNDSFTMVRELPPALQVHEVRLARPTVDEQNDVFRGVLTTKLGSDHSVPARLVSDIVCCITKLKPADAEVAWAHNTRQLSRVEDLYHAYLKVRSGEALPVRRLQLQACAVAIKHTYAACGVPTVTLNAIALQALCANNKHDESCDAYTVEFVRLVGRVTNPPLWLDEAYREAIDEVVSQNNFHFPSGVHLTRTLKEYLFLCLVCIVGRIPLTFVDVPGTGKTTAVGIIESNMQGPHSSSKFFKNLPCKLTLVQFQGRGSTTAAVVHSHFKRAEFIQSSNSGSGGSHEVVVCVLYDEAGMPKHSTCNKALHEYLDRRRIACIALSNSNFDVAVKSRFLVVAKSALEASALKELTRGMLPHLNEIEASALADAFSGTNSSLHHHRDYVYMLRQLQSDARAAQNTRAIVNNFSGHASPDVVAAFVAGFTEALGLQSPSSAAAVERPSLQDLLSVDRRLDGGVSRSRFLLFITDSPDMVETDVLHDLLRQHPRQPHELWPSPLAGDQTEDREAAYASQVRRLAKGGGCLLLRGHVNPVVSPSHTLMNRQPRAMEDENKKIVYYELITIGALQERVVVSESFNVVAIIPRYLVQKTPDATLSRFEKHALSLPPRSEELKAALEAFAERLGTQTIVGYIKGQTELSVLWALAEDGVTEEVLLKRCRSALWEQTTAPWDKFPDDVRRDLASTRPTLTTFKEQNDSTPCWFITSSDESIRKASSDAFDVIDVIEHTTEDGLRRALETKAAAKHVVLLATPSDDLPFLKYVVYTTPRSYPVALVVLTKETKDSVLVGKVSTATKGWRSVYMPEGV